MRLARLHEEIKETDITMGGMNTAPTALLSLFSIISLK